MKLMLVHEVAARLGCTPDNVRVLERSGKLRASRIGHIRVFRASAVERFREQLEQRRELRQRVGQ